MRMKFVGGPWDGVEFEAPFYPDQIFLQNMDAVFEEGKEAGTEVMHMQVSEQHQYLADRTESEGKATSMSEWAMRERDDAGLESASSLDEEVIVTVYRYAVGEEPLEEQA